MELTSLRTRAPKALLCLQEASEITGGIGVPGFVKDAANGVKKGAKKVAGGITRAVDGGNSYHTDTYRDSDFWYDAGHLSAAVADTIYS